MSQQLTLAEYRDLLAGVSMPSDSQIEAFASFVSTAHSWYKHLPLLPPGVPMVFFLDPGAGAQRIIDRRGRMEQTERLEHGFHYSWIQTAQYRGLFGRASYARTAGTGTVASLISADRSQLIPSDNEPVIFEPGRGHLVALPDEVLEAGTAYVSAVIHPRAAWYPVWSGWQLPPCYDDPARVQWPPESGGTDAYVEILARVNALRDGAPVQEQSLDEDEAMGDKMGHNGDLVLHRLLRPERERQQHGVVAALNRVIDLVR